MSAADWKRKKRIFVLAVIFVLAFTAGQEIARINERKGLADASPVIRLADIPEADTQEAEPGDTKEETLEMKKIALTFDDGPNPDYTEKLLKGLKKRGVKATFFVLGAEVEKEPDILRRMQKEGHLIGVHSYKHVNFGEIGDEAAMEQIEKTQEAIYAVTGEYAGFIRPPYGSWKESLNEKVPMIEVLWDVDPLDWSISDPDTVVQRILKEVEQGHTIILMHDASKSSVQAALTVIDILQEQGYQFVTVEELLLE